MRYNWVLVLILGLAIYIYNLDRIPNGVYYDEAVVGYNAFSIVKTLRDEYGQMLPLYFKFFGSYTPGLFVYIQTIPIMLGGLSPWVLRIVSVMSMLVMGLGIYFFSKKELKLRWPGLTMLLFLLTPWTIFNARLGYETTFAFMLMGMGLLLFRNATLSFMLISLSTYAAHGQRYLAPLLICLIYWCFYRGRNIWKPILAAAVLQIPNIFLMFTPAFWVKSGEFGNNFLNQYLSYFSPVNLFSLGDYDLQRSIPQLSVFYPWMFVFWLGGIYYIYKNFNRPMSLYLLGLILISPIPAAMAGVNFSTQRALVLLLPFFLLIAVGLDRVVGRLGKVFGLGLIMVLLGYSGIRLWRSYFILFPVQRAVAWGYGYQQVAEFVEQNKESKIVIDNSRGVPYIELLYWRQYDPAKYQQENGLINSADYYSNTSYNGNRLIGNVEVRRIYWKEDIYKPQILIGDDLAISEDQVKEHKLIEVFKIRDPRFKLIWQGYQTDPVAKCRSEVDKPEICRSVQPLLFKRGTSY